MQFYSTALKIRQQTKDATTCETCESTDYK